MNKKILFFNFLFCFQAIAYTPTIDSLFRNGNNEDIGENTVVGILNIERIVNQESELDSLPRKNAFKILIGNEDEKRPKFVQVEYKDGIVSDATMNKIYFKQIFDLESLGLRSPSQVEAATFYSLLSSLLSNNSKLMMDLLKTLEPQAKNNRELINDDQQRLLKQYKYYLKKMAENEDQTDFLNPLAGETPEQKEKIQEILSTSFLVKDQLVKRIREKNRFYWDYTGSKVSARFDGENHQLKKLSITTDQGKLEIDCYNYILFNGKLEFPEVIYFRDFSGQLYEIKMSKIFTIKENPGSFNKRVEAYEKTLNKNENKNLDLIKPVFLI